MSENNEVRLPEVIVFAGDNTKEPFRIFKKRKDIYYRWNNQYWSSIDIEKLSGITEYIN